KSIRGSGVVPRTPQGHSKREPHAWSGGHLARGGSERCKGVGRSAEQQVYVAEIEPRIGGRRFPGDAPFKFGAGLVEASKLEQDRPIVEPPLRSSPSAGAQACESTLREIEGPC